MSARNLVDFLDRHAAKELEALRASYPEASNLLRWDRDLGGETNVGFGDLAAQRALAEAGIAAMQVRGDAIVATLSRRLRRAQQLKMWGALLAAIANAGLLASLSRIVNFGTTTSEMILALVAMSGSSFAVLADRAGGSRVGQLFDEALALSVRVMRCDQTRQRNSLTNAREEEWDTLLQELDAIALDLHAVEMKAKIA